MSERPPPQQQSSLRPSSFTNEINELIKSGRDHLRAGRLDQAWAAFESALRRAPDDADALYASGLVLLMREKYAEAAKYLGRAETAFAADADFNANYGLALRGVGQPEAAKIRFRRVLAARPDHAVALYNFALLLLEDRDWRPAAELLGRLAALKPQEAEVSFLLGRALAGLGHTDDARDCFGRALRLAPEDEDIRLGLAEFELDRGRPEAAESVLAEIVARARNLNVPMVLAEIRERLGDAPGREQCLTRAREIEPRAVDVMYEAAFASQEAGSAELVAKLFRRCLALDPGHIHARVALDRLLPNIYAADAEIEPVRRGYETGLESLERLIRDPATSDAALSGIFGNTNFYLAYQERNDRDLQIRYGRLATDMLRARIPLSRDVSRSMPPPEPDGRLRIGIFTRF
ncbi:MAG: tetratricopeptide repeat protein, partial [Alphaproteobacteria bacterium]|nr:tetratricopeptide repeat protein [Alphaproteobacteria bacterium]